MTKMQRVCAWCGKDMGEIEAKQTGTTHGICEECKEKELAKIREHYPGMAVERAIEILGEAATGVLTLNDNFKEAMKMGQQALISLKGVSLNAQNH